MKENFLNKDGQILDEVSVYQYIEDLIKEKYTIIIVTLIFIIIATFYSLSIKPLYRSEALISKTNDISVAVLLEKGLTRKSNESPVSKSSLLNIFLEALLTEKFQKDVFLSNKLTKAYVKNMKGDVDTSFRGFIKSLEVYSDDIKKKEYAYIPKHVRVTMDGYDIKMTSSYLNDLLHKALDESLDGFLNARIFEVEVLVKSSKIELEYLLMQEEILVMARANLIESLKQEQILDRQVESHLTQGLLKATELKLKIFSLEVRLMQLKDKLLIENNDIRMATLSRAPFADHTPINSNAFKIILTSAILGFLLSIIFILFRHVYNRGKV